MGCTLEEARALLAKIHELSGGVDPAIAKYLG
jgi:hypothetical protein